MIDSPANGPITPEGYPFIGAFALISLILFLDLEPARLGRHRADACGAFYFFRDPPA